MSSLNLVMTQSWHLTWRQACGSKEGAQVHNSVDQPPD